MADAITTAKLAWQSGPVVRSSQFKDIYFSDIDGLAETKHVFISGNNLQQKFADISEASPHFNFTLGELGFGTGLNFLATWAEWAKKSHSAGHLTFVTTEAFPLNKEDFAKAQKKISSNWPELSTYSEQLSSAYPALLAGVHTILLAEDVTLQLMLGDAATSLSKYSGLIDCWYLDGFSPSTNPEMWSNEIFKQMANHSHQGTSLATFSVAGFVRRGLTDAGFEVEKTEGFARKKHMLIGQFTNKQENNIKSKPYYSYSNLTPSQGKRALVVGAGIAGASLAWHLKQTGFEVTVIDKNGIASGASGNPAGLIMPRLDLDQNSDAQLYLHAWLYSSNLINILEKRTGTTILTHPGGIRLATNESDAKKHQKLALQAVGETGLIRSINEKEAANRSGISIPTGGTGPHLSYDIGGTLSPKAFISALLEGSTIIEAELLSFRHNAQPNEIIATIRTEYSEKETQTDHLFIASSVHADQYMHRPTCTASMGQIDILDHTPPNCSITAGQYIAPYMGQCVVGATYKNVPLDTSPDVNSRNSTKNILSMKELIGLPVDETIITNSRASLRCFTNDRHPIAGPVPDWQYYQEHYDRLSVKREADLTEATYIPNTYILTALGSRGFITAPYCAAFISALATERPNPLDLDKQQLIHPARFFVRQEKRRS